MKLEYKANLFSDKGPFRRELYPKHLEFFKAGATYTERAFVGGNRCITPWTPIEMGRATRQLREILDEREFDVRSWDGGSRCSKQASGVFLKGIEPAFRVLLGNGQFFDCSYRHRVLTDGGYFRSLGQLVRASDVLHCRRRFQGSQASYAKGDRLCDEPLRSDQDSVLGTPPSLTDVLTQTNSAFLLDGAEAHRSRYSHASQACGRLATLDGLQQLWDLCGMYEDPGASLDAQWSPATLLELRQFATEFCRLRLAESEFSDQSLRSDPWDVSSGSCGDLDTFVGHGERSLDRSLYLQWIRPGQFDLEFVNDTARTQTYDCFVPLRPNSFRLFGGQPINNIIYLGNQPILDFTVKDSHIYETGGVFHHNTGKSTLGAYELSCHLTGEYADWWEGRRFDHPVRCWAAGDTSHTVRDIIQEKLLGPPGSFGTGLIPKRCIIRHTAKRNVADALQDVYVKHISGGTSALGFKSYDQGRESFQGTAQHCVWLDEEANLQIYTEILLRTMTVNGIVFCTFTPMLGLSDVVLSFMPDGIIPEGGVTPDGKWVCQVSWGEAVHLSDKQKETYLKSIPHYQREARIQGIPMLGSGAIYPIAQDEYMCDPIQIPDHWPRVFSLDIGWNMTAALWGAWDREGDVVYIYSEYFKSQAEPAIHAAAIRGRGDWISGVIDPAARGRTQNDGTRLIDIYRELGLNLIEADNAVESGIYTVWERLSTGRLKIFKTLPNLLKELRIYRRDEKGKIVKSNDHGCDSLRYLLVSGLDLATTKPPLFTDEDNYWMHQSRNEFTGY